MHLLIKKITKSLACTGTVPIKMKEEIEEDRMKKLCRSIVALMLVAALTACTKTSEPKGTAYKAGSYTAEVDGHNGKVKIEVEFSDEAIVSVKAVEHAETAGLGDKAMEKLAAEIVDAQSLKLDTVAGATVSSNALLSAVEDCVTQAEGDVEALKNKEVVQKESKYEQAEITADYIVIGAGPAGLASAVEMAEAGYNVVVFEKTSVSGGAAKYGMGPLGLETDLQKAQGEVITVDEAYNMFMEYTHYRVDGQLVYDYFKMSNDTINWLEDMGVEFQEAARYFDKSTPSWHIVKSDNGTVGGGQAETMTRKMTERAVELGVTFYYETPVQSITTENGVVTGVVAVNENENKEYHASSQAVLVATGGFGNNVEMIEEELGYVWGEDYFGMKFAGHEGDGVNMARAIGADPGNPNIEMIFNIYANNGPAITSDVMILMRQPGMLVNKEGERFFNEEQVQNTTYTGNALVQQTGNTGYMILSESMIQDYIDHGVDFTSKVYQCDDFSTFYASIDSMIEGGSISVFKGNSIKEVSDYIGCDEQTLQQTFDTYNQQCADGHDPYGKSSEYLNAFDGSTLYVAQYYPGSYGTLGGIGVNSKLQVVDADNKAIAGLYSAGTDSCEIFGDSYMFLLPGNTMGYSINSGRIAARSAMEIMN